MKYGIGNTADFGMSGLDERQAASLLSAVGGHGLSLVEPGPTTDPVAAGLNAAINRAYHAWIHTQPQLILELWPDDRGLDETQSSALRLVEPVDYSSSRQRHRPVDGLTNGAEPRHAPPGELTASVPMRGPALPLPPRYPGGGSAPHNNATEVAADPARDTRGDLRKGA